MWVLISGCGAVSTTWIVLNSSWSQEETTWAQFAPQASTKSYQISMHSDWHRSTRYRLILTRSVIPTDMQKKASQSRDMVRMSSSFTGLVFNSCREIITHTAVRIRNNLILRHGFFARYVWILSSKLIKSPLKMLSPSIGFNRLSIKTHKVNSIKY